MSRVEELEAELALVSELLEKYEELKRVKQEIAAKEVLMPFQEERHPLEDIHQLYIPDENGLSVNDYTPFTMSALFHYYPESPNHVPCIHTNTFLPPIKYEKKK